MNRCTFPEKSDLEGLVCRLLGKSPLGMILSSATPEREEDMTHLYLADFVHMIHRPRSAHPSMELEVLLDCFIH